MFVENKPGGAGVIAMTEVSKADPDGHTIILGHVGTLAVNPYAMPKHPYDVNKEFAPVILLARVPNVLAVAPDVPAKTLKEFVALAKAKPDSITYGSAGEGRPAIWRWSISWRRAASRPPTCRVRGPDRCCRTSWRSRAGDLHWRPAPMGQISAGKLRALAVGSHERMASLPECSDRSPRVATGL